MKLLGAPITGKLVAGVAVAFTLMLAGMGVMGWQLLKCHQGLGECSQEKRQAVRANRQQTDRIHELSAELIEITRSLEISEREAAQRLRQRDRALAERETELQRARTERRALYERQPDCAELAQMELCGDMDTRIRDRLEALKSEAWPSSGP